MRLMGGIYHLYAFSYLEVKDGNNTLYKLYIRIYTVWIYNYVLIQSFQWDIFHTRKRPLIIPYSKILCNVKKINNYVVTNVRLFCAQTPSCCAQNWDTNVRLYMAPIRYLLSVFNTLSQHNSWGWMESKFCWFV